MHLCDQVLPSPSVKWTQQPQKIIKIRKFRQIAGVQTLVAFALKTFRKIRKKSRWQSTLMRGQVPTGHWAHQARLWKQPAMCKELKSWKNDNQQSSTSTNDNFQSTPIRKDSPELHRYIMHSLLRCATDWCRALSQKCKMPSYSGEPLDGWVTLSGVPQTPS